MSIEEKLNSTLQAGCVPVDGGLVPVLALTIQRAEERSCLPYSRPAVWWLMVFFFPDAMVDYQRCHSSRMILRLLLSFVWSGATTKIEGGP
jgi:hypothetical protein